MAQRLSAFANGPGAAGPQAPPSPEPPEDARARAAAYLDLWERRLVRAATRGWGERPAEDPEPPR